MGEGVKTKVGLKTEEGMNIERSENRQEGVKHRKEGVKTGW